MTPITSTSMGQIALVDGSDEAAPVVVRIVEAVADARGVSVDSLDPLASCFDVDALERFIESATTSTKIGIEFEECTVVIDGDGNVAVNRGEIL